jgi:hypothetical protein
MSPTTFAVVRKPRSELQRAIAVELQDQRAVELDARLHQQAGCRHFAHQRAHRRRKGAHRCATPQRLAPVRAEADDGAAHRQAFEQELVQETLVQDG